MIPFSTERFADFATFGFRRGSHHPEAVLSLSHRSITPKHQWNMVEAAGIEPETVFLTKPLKTQERQ
jgi:hypothetical protein